MANRTLEWNKKISLANKGKHNHFGVNNPNWKGGITKPKEITCSDCLKVFMTIRNKTGFCLSCNSRRNNFGKQFTEERKHNISLATMGRTPWNKGVERQDIMGSKNGNWKGGITPHNTILRSSLKLKKWKEAIFKRDNFTCKWCKQYGGKLQADHIKPFAWFMKLRFELSNGQALCENCHKWKTKMDNKIYQGQVPKLNIIYN